MSKNIKELFEKYKDWVSSNPVPASDVEATVKWISYYLAARVKNTKVVTELVYSLSNLLVLYNDRIITNAYHPLPGPATTADKIKLWLSILEYVEVLFEVTAREAWNERGKWGVAAFIQTIKCIGRLLLVVKYKEHIVQIPPIPPLRRRDAHLQTLPSQSTKIGFRLPTSGRIVRSVDGGKKLSTFFNPKIKAHGGVWLPDQAQGPNLIDTKGMRTWKPPTVCEVFPDGTAPDAILDTRKTFAEITYILKPLLHLCVLIKCGPKTWRPYILALLLDLISLQFLQKSNPVREPFSTRQSMELSRRRIALLLYILRSPFYERYSGRRIDSLLHSLSSNLPLVGIILRPLAEYLPTWQDTYFYMWST